MLRVYGSRASELAWSRARSAISRVIIGVTPFRVSTAWRSSGWLFGL